jgi:hypothetical protein
MIQNVSNYEAFLTGGVINYLKSFKDEYINLSKVDATTYLLDRVEVSVRTHPSDLPEMTSNKLYIMTNAGVNIRMGNNLPSEADATYYFATPVSFSASSTDVPSSAAMFSVLGAIAPIALKKISNLKNTSIALPNYEDQLTVSTEIYPQGSMGINDVAALKLIWGNDTTIIPGILFFQINVTYLISWVL